MTTFMGKVGVGGSLVARKVDQSPSFWWALRNKLRWPYIHGALGYFLGPALGKLLGFGVFVSELSAVHIDGETGKRTNFGVVSRKVVTNAFVQFVVDQLQTETSVFGDFLYHDSGVGVTAPAVGDTDIETTDGESRVSGSQTEGASANIYKSVGTITYTTTKAITEHGLFNASTAGTLMDRSTFTAINVVNTDQIEFTYEITFSAGG